MSYNGIKTYTSQFDLFLSPVNTLFSFIIIMSLKNHEKVFKMLVVAVWILKWIVSLTPLNWLILFWNLCVYEINLSWKSNMFLLYLPNQEFSWQDLDHKRSCFLVQIPYTFICIIDDLFLVSTSFIKSMFFFSSFLIACNTCSFQRDQSM